MTNQINIFDIIEKGDKDMTKKTKTTGTEQVEKTSKEQYYTWPFDFAIGADRLSPIPLANAKDGDKFTINEIKDFLKNMVLELNAPGTELHYIEDRNTFVMSGQLAKKG